MALGCLIFFDDYSSILIVGNSLREVVRAVGVSEALQDCMMMNDSPNNNEQIYWHPTSTRTRDTPIIITPSLCVMLLGRKLIYSYPTVEIKVLTKR